MQRSDEIIATLNAALPSRPIKTKSEWHAYIPPISLILLLFIGYGALHLSQATVALLKERTLSQNLTPLDLPVTAQCDALPTKKSSRLRRNPLGYHCQIEATIHGHLWQQSIYATLIYAEELEQIELLADQENPNRYTTTLAQAKQSSQLKYIGQSLLLLLIALYLAYRILRATYRYLTDPGHHYEWTTLPYQVSRSTFIRYQIINFEWKNRRYKTTFALNESPLFLHNSQTDEREILALIDPHAQHPPTIIDKKLKRINLTQEERAPLLKIINHLEEI